MRNHNPYAYTYPAFYADPNSNTYTFSYSYPYPYPYATDLYSENYVR